MMPNDNMTHQKVLSIIITDWWPLSIKSAHLMSFMFTQTHKPVFRPVVPDEK